MIAWIRLTRNGPGVWIASPSEFKVYSVRRHARLLCGWAIKFLPRCRVIPIRRLDDETLERLRKRWEDLFTGPGPGKKELRMLREVPTSIEQLEDLAGVGRWFGFRWKRR